MRLVGFALLTCLWSGPSTSADPLWIDRAAAQPWLAAISAASERSGLPAAVIGELIGLESGYRNAVNPRSGERGFGQQIPKNRFMLSCRLDPLVPEDSIMGAALELRSRLDASGGDMTVALRGYGTTADMSDAQRRKVEDRFRLAASKIGDVADRHGYSGLRRTYGPKSVGRSQSACECRPQP